ncbi:MAG: hypothetical protein M0R69_05420 [Candidatus Cloacimonetes bacterium]|jgi:hypothetical protein|nr:hypothetical protein [Candidatus Cloacimonadota bacterium]
MKKLRYFILLGSVLFLLSACESGGKFNIINQTSYPIYASVDGEPVVTIPAQTNHAFNIDTDSQSFLTGEVTHTVPVHVVGETFSLYDSAESQYVDHTVATVRAGRTTNAFLKPNRASIKIVNNRPEKIYLFEISQINPTTNFVVATVQRDIPTGTSYWYRVKYASVQDNFTYRLEIYLEGEENPLTYFAPTVLGNDEQWVLQVDPPEEI